MDDPQMAQMTQMGVTSNRGLVGLSKALPDQPDEIALNKGLSAAISGNYLLGLPTGMWGYIDSVRWMIPRWSI
jgi:hypothetical protein